jgi:hypothetical protein
MSFSAFAAEDGQNLPLVSQKTWKGAVFITLCGLEEASAALPMYYLGKAVPLPVFLASAGLATSFLGSAEKNPKAYYFSGALITGALALKLVENR